MSNWAQTHAMITLLLDGWPERPPAVEGGAQSVTHPLRLAARAMRRAAASRARTEIERVE